VSGALRVRFSCAARGDRVRDPITTSSANADYPLMAEPCPIISRVQLVTVEHLLMGGTIDGPPIQTITTFKRAPRAATNVAEARRLDDAIPETFLRTPPARSDKQAYKHSCSSART
jgi:hypothetical protein